ncbi:phosphate ABC transporter permease PstA [Defluviitalea phaphyphila]|uniref:phosphate ABC transporter permease PstA n=1 Tax=Defluviitalea phaphyphila TaxID=1473580 RepID=UPI0007308BF2|nr:phosphate ABC transporter permease PstA [Defluviitalea phaphyphila]
MKTRKIKDAILMTMIIISSFITVGILTWILIYVVANGIGKINWEFLSTAPKGFNEGGIFPMIITTIYIVLLSILISTPIGVCAAIYLVEYAKQGKIVRIIRFATESLSGIPSIIFGLFGYLFFVNQIGWKYSILSGAMTLSIMVLPTIIRTTEESLKAVPNSYREGSLGLGASKLKTIIKVILPSAISGIITSIILSIGRIVGETAAVYFTAGFAPRMAKSIMDSSRTLSVHMYVLTKEGDFDKGFATATVLIIVVLIINFMANFMSKKFNKTRM